MNPKKDLSSISFVFQLINVNAETTTSSIDVEASSQETSRKLNSKTT